MDIDTFGEWLLDEMDKRNLNCYQLSRMSGLNHVTIANYVTQTRSPTFASLKMILDAFGKHVEIVDN